MRETLGSLPTRLVDTEISPAMAMTDWLTTEAPDNFSIRQGAELKVPGDEGSIARFKRQVMDCDEVRQHLGVGKIATRLDMAFGERLTFTLTEALEVKSLAMLDVLKDEIKDMDAETQDALFESQMALLIGELRLFIPALLEILGGELEPAAVTEKAENKAMQDEADSFYADAVEFVRKTQRASISAVQRQFRIGYNRAARLIEQMETDGIVSQMESNGSRTVLAPKGGAK
ncbi:hypothetical protein GKO28_17960 [Deefgea sp. CFH1-16]|nr:hypothetical protein [Deefgea sp. CFH1-16]